MKVCPNCQTPFGDDSLKFCLQCGAVLSAPLRSYKTGGNGVIIAAILGGFTLLTLLVGGAGAYFFSLSDDKPLTEMANSRSAPDDKDENSAGENAQSPSVVQLSGNKQSAPFPVNSPADASNPVNKSNSAPPPPQRIVTSSSSVRKAEAGNFYFPSFAFDNNSATAWCEGVKGAGTGEWLQFNFDRPVMLSAIKIEPGYFKSEVAWSKNNRVARISVKLSDHSTREFSLNDEKKAQTLYVGRTRTDWVKLTIEEYFAGNADSDDTLISEISFVTEP